MLKAGDRVKVMFPLDESGVTPGMRLFQEAEMVVKRTFSQRGTIQDVTLYGARSATGIDFHFASDWLIPLKEGEGK